MSEPIGDESYLTMADQTTLRVITRGTGPTVLLLHGLGSNIQEWNLIWQKLTAKGYRVITFDQRGHGSSNIGSDGIDTRVMVGDIKTIFESLHLEDVVVVGHSMGGFLLLRLILEYGEVIRNRLRGIILFASFAGNILKGAPQNQIQIPLLKTGLLDRIIKNDVLGRLLVKSLFGEPHEEANLAMLHCLRKQKLAPLAPIVNDFIRENYYPRLNQIKIPCLIIAGELDKTAPSWHARELLNGIKESRLIVVSKKGHALNWECPDVLVEAVEKIVS